MSKKIPFFYHPTAAIFIDDQELFIHSTLAIVDNLTNCRSFLDPKEALKYIKAVDIGALFLENFNHLDDKGEVLITQKELTNYLSDLQRFVLESTLVVDYAMPKLNGLELCEEIEGQAFKKIMLTGEASSDIAIKALNHHIIDRFIHKNNPQVFEDLNQALLELRMQFFDELSHEVLATRKLPAFLYTQAFGDFFAQIFQKYNGVEYYLINTLGDFLVIDDEGHTTWICVRDEAGQTFTRNFLTTQYKKKPNDEIEFALEHLSKGNEYLFAYGFGSFNKGYKNLVVAANPIKFDRYQCYYAALPVKLDLKIKPLNAQKPQYMLAKEEEV